MQSVRMLGAIAAGAMMVASAAAAETPNAQEQAAPARIEPVDWRCEGDRCVGDMRPKARPDALLRECEKVVAAIGPVSSYRARGLELNADQLRRCNRYATSVPVSLR